MRMGLVIDHPIFLLLAKETPAKNMHTCPENIAQAGTFSPTITSVTGIAAKTIKAILRSNFITRITPPRHFSMPARAQRVLLLRRGLMSFGWLLWGGGQRHPVGNFTALKLRL